jgi:hypothetical protein
VKRLTHARDVNDLQARNSRRTAALDFLCECGAATCTAVVRITTAQYTAVDRARGQLLVAAGHRDLPAFGVVRDLGPALVVEPLDAGPAGVR